MENISIVIYIHGQRRTESVLMACQVGFSTLSFLTTGSFQTESWASARHLYLIVCLLHMILSSMLCLVSPYLSNTTPGMREVITMSSTSPVLTICYLKIYGDVIPTRREDICSNVILSNFRSLPKRKKKEKKTVLFLTGILEGEVSSSFHGFSIKGIVHRVYI